MAISHSYVSWPCLACFCQWKISRWLEILVLWIFLSNYLCFFMHGSGSTTGTVFGGLDNPKLTYNGNVNLRAGINKISLLSVAVGLPVSEIAPSPVLFHISDATRVQNSSFDSIDFIISERWCALREVECRSSWSCYFEGTRWGYKRLDKAEMVL